MTMRTVLCLVCGVSAGAAISASLAYGLPPGPPAPRPPATVDIGFFYDALEPDGDWMSIDPYGWVWVPNAVDPFWRPYTVGRWAWTDWGWTWVSAERWGWATDHYGRWVRLGRHGWAWVPGDVWGPAWVAWRSGPGVVGWAPLPPEARFRVGIGLDWGGIDINVAIRLDQWCFVDDTRFADNDVHRFAYPVGRNTTVFRGTRDFTRIGVRDGRIVNEGIDRAEIERRTHRAILARRVVDSPRADRRSSQIAANEIRFFRPELRNGPSDAAPRSGRRPTEPTRPASDPWTNDGAEHRWDHRWNQDWDKLERLQRRDEAVHATPTPRPRPEVLERVRDENMEAAENAYRELVAERERTDRRAERGPQKADRDGKGREKKN